MADTETLAAGLFFPEGPRWHEGRFWFSDFYSRTVYSVDLEGDLRAEIELTDDQPSGLGWLADGSLLVVAMTSRTVRKVGVDGQLTTHAALADIATHHCNDMIVDSHGRAYVGNMGFDLQDFLDTHGGRGIFDEPRPVPASLAMVEPDGRVHRVANGLSFPNGMAITADGSTLLVAQTTGFEITVFDRHADGTLTNRRVWADLLTATGKIWPDGICLDSGGGLWVADGAGSGVHRIVEGGDVTSTVDAGQPAYACVLGGPERRHLFVCNAPSARPDVVTASPAGRVDVIEVDHAGVGIP
jgi:sugar lactone lactonase YvrE